jgi:hypothetical protein
MKTDIAKPLGASVKFSFVNEISELHFMTDYVLVLVVYS